MTRPKTVRVFEYEDNSREVAIIREIEVDEIAAQMAQLILSKIPDARFGFEPSVPFDEDPDGKTRYAEMRLEGTILADDKDGERRPTFHDLYIHSPIDETKIEEADWSEFVMCILENCKDFLREGDQEPTHELNDDDRMCEAHGRVDCLECIR